MDHEILIQAKNLQRYYGTHCVVNKVSFEVKRGEVLGFLGPNGAGKSTTMQMLTGNLAPSSGQIIINGIDILEQPKAAKLSLGFLPEQPPLYRELSVDEYLRYCARLNRIDSKRLLQAVEKSKQRCGLTEVGGRVV